MIRFVLMTWVFCAGACAQNAKLEAALSPLKDMRGKPVDFGGPRNATPGLTTVKHALRDWVESRLAGFRQDGDLGELERTLNGSLRGAGVLCGPAPSMGSCPDGTLLGYLNKLKLRRAQSFLVLQTAVGIECGFDESAYLYAWSDEGWRRVWQNEQNTYTEKDYQPQKILAVLVSQWNPSNEYVVLTLGVETWCQSTLHNVYWRAYRLGPDPLAKPLVNGVGFARIGEGRPIHGSVSTKDILVQFDPADPDETQPAVRHYQIEDGTARRIDPIALSPQSFVLEWFASDWRESAPWSEDARRPSLLDVHDKFKDKVGPDSLNYPALHCKAPDIWQVGARLGEQPDSKPYYFLVRWQPPFRFTMVEASVVPSFNCREEDPDADERRTLFP
jgi:hypothetical protein